MINLEQFLPIYPLSMATIVLTLVIHGWYFRKWNYLWLTVFVILSQFVPLLESTIILFISFFLLPKKMRVVNSLLITLSLLAPSEIKGFFYLALTFWQLEYFLSGPSAKKLEESLPAFIFLYFSKSYIGPQVELVGNYLLILMSLRMLLFVRSAHQVLLSAYFLLIMLALLSKDSTHSLVAVACLGGALLHFSDTALKERSIEETLMGAFYERPKYFFLFLVAWACGPLYLMASLMMASPLYMIPLLCLMLAFSYCALSLFTSGRCLLEKTAKPSLPSRYILGLLFYSLVSFFICFYQLKTIDLANTFISWALTLLLVAFAYGLLKFFWKDDILIDQRVKLIGSIFSTYQHTLDVQVQSVELPVEKSVEKRASARMPDLIGESFAFPVVLFFVVMVGLIILMGEMQV